MADLLGGKGTNLSAMSNLGLPGVVCGAAELEVDATGRQVTAPGGWWSARVT